MSSRRRRRNQAGQATGVNLLDVVPERAAEWDEDPEGRITLIRKRPTVRGPRSLAAWVSSVTGPPRVRLDDVGSFVWRHIDGTRDVRMICGAVQAEFGQRVEPVPERLGQLIRILKRERLVSYRGTGARYPAP